VRHSWVQVGTGGKLPEPVARKTVFVVDRVQRAHPWRLHSSSKTANMRSVFVLDIAKNAFRAFPPTRRIYKRRRSRRGYDPNKNDSSYVKGVFKWHSQAVARYDRSAGGCWRLGPGGNLGSVDCSSLPAPMRRWQSTLNPG